ncbi:MAG: flagellar biosynthetic protein FliR [Pirellulales bacterium]|nr:flagellar biosynthetic protein FliR [Pirellulales bacterium]
MLPDFGLDKLLLFTLVLSRISGLTMTAPIFGTKDVPMQVRALLAAALAFLILPTQWHIDVGYPGSLANYLLFIGSELIIGLCLGLGIVILFSGLQVAGQLIGRTGGMMMANVLDPASGTEIPLFSRLLFLLALAIFVCIGGHRMVMAALLDTFQSIPPGSGTIGTAIVPAFTDLITQSFALGIRSAAPVVTAILLSTLIMGLISRTMPQLNILAVGFGMNSMLTFGVLALSIGSSVYIYQDEIEPTLTLMLQAIQGQ